MLGGDSGYRRSARWRISPVKQTGMKTRAMILLLVGGAAALVCRAAPPSDFPQFAVPGHEKEMVTARELFWLHYPGAGPKATLWDEWLPAASLWPAVNTDDSSDKMRQAWRDTLSARIIDAEGYVATHQHASIAHQLGWPFPFWNQGRRGFGWHFSFKNTVGPGWRPNELNQPEGWQLDGATAASLNDDGWRIEVTNTSALVAVPAKTFDTFEAPFLQLRWQAAGLGNAQPYIDWTTTAATNFSATRRVYFDSAKGGGMTCTMVPMYRHPQWTGDVSQVRIGLGNTAPGSVVLQAFFSQYDTRHNINSQNFIRGCAKYFWWTRDLNFLRANINRMRTALRYVMSEHQAQERNIVYSAWVGHDGRSGLKRTADGKKEIITGRGIGNNYWDLMPFGNLDCYATIQYYDAVIALAQVESEVLAHPEWNIPRGVLSFDPEKLKEHAADVKAKGNAVFWNNRTQRFNACIDADGHPREYGYTFLNLEAVFYDFATPEHAKAILGWVNGDRVVEGDTAQGPDIYHWRFAPRATTRRNIDWYFWAWSNPEGIPWGGQVQDGGAVLGFSYHDLMARLKVLGPDNAWRRLREILKWFDDVQAAGGYRKYYDGTAREGTLQGGGTAGGLGLDHEFFESVLVPQVMLYGFLGFAPRADGFTVNPQLPSDWPELTVDRIRFQNLILKVRVTRDHIEIHKQGDTDEPIFAHLPEGEWKTSWLPVEGISKPAALSKRKADGAFEVNWKNNLGVRFESKSAQTARP